MRERMSSYQLMKVLDDAEDSIGSLRSDVNSMREELGKELSIFSNSMEFAMESIGRFDEYLLQKEGQSVTTAVLADMEILDGEYEKYGLSVHPVCMSVPTNVFNFQSATGPIFKNNANIYLGNKAMADYVPMLMHDAIKGKGTAFGELESDTVTLRIEVNPNDLFGATTCNTIEFLPYISGSFDITQIRIYSMSDYRSKSSIPTLLLDNTIPNIGAQRIILEDGVDLYACEIDMKLKFCNAAGKYPFGFRHIYFLEGNYSNEATILFKMSRENYIDWISDVITVHDQDGIRSTTCTEEGIKLYGSYSYGVLSAEILPSRGVIQNTIPRNIRDFYVQMPISKCVSSIRFKEINER